MGQVMKAVFDTNILVDYLNGVAAANHEIERYDEIAISIVTWMEVLAGADDAEEEAITREFLSRFKVQPVEKVGATRRLRRGCGRCIRTKCRRCWRCGSPTGCRLICGGWRRAAGSGTSDDAYFSVCHPERSSVRAQAGRNAVEGSRWFVSAPYVIEPPRSLDSASPAFPSALRSG